MNDQKLLLTVEEAAASLSIGRTFMYNLIKQGRLPAIHIGKSVRVQQADLEAFIKAEREAQNNGPRI